MKIFNEENIKKSLSNIIDVPFNHCVIDNFFTQRIATKLCHNFPKYNSNIYHVYKNKLEDKKTCNNWNAFDPLTYDVFRQLNSDYFIKIIRDIAKDKLISDPGLHGGGWHIHANKGELNPHLDYSIHPKTNLQRRINLIIYLEDSYKAKYGGYLGFWEHDKSLKQPGKLIKEIYPKFNRAVIFDTSQNSWHGLSRKIQLPKTVFRKSIAVYYLCIPNKNHLTNNKALFAPRKNQKNIKEIKDLIKTRSDSNLFYKAYKK
jgi:Rps23 Pro-64 3,4-dihydroxylase Tpa1-like proline 4-hydroxylase